MASPVAHSFAGFWTFLLLLGRSRLHLFWHRRRQFCQLAMLVFVANLPDFDFLLSLLARGNLNDLHHEFTHSLLAGSIAAVGLALIWPMATTFLRSALLYFVAYGSHLVIDFFTGTPLGWSKGDSGIPLFWPASHKFHSPFILMLGVQHKDVPRLWSTDNALSAGYELLLCAAITAVILLIRSRYAQDS
jgi:LexA-binding, inner membrane-associated putative hydrolase